MPINLLKHKSYHVNSARNIERVQRDEEVARAARAEEERERREKERSERMEILRSRSLQQRQGKWKGADNEKLEKKGGRDQLPVEKEKEKQNERDQAQKQKHTHEKKQDQEQEGYDGDMERVYNGNIVSLLAGSASADVPGIELRLSRNASEGRQGGRAHDRRSMNSSHTTSGQRGVKSVKGGPSEDALLLLPSTPSTSKPKKGRSSSSTQAHETRLKSSLDPFADMERAILQTREVEKKEAEEKEKDKGARRKRRSLEALEPSEALKPKRRHRDHDRDYDRERENRHRHHHRRHDR